LLSMVLPACYRLILAVNGVTCIAPVDHLLSIVLSACNRLILAVNGVTYMSPVDPLPSMVLPACHRSILWLTQPPSRPAVLPLILLVLHPQTTEHISPCAWPLCAFAPLLCSAERAAYMKQHAGHEVNRHTILLIMSCTERVPIC